MSNIKGLIGPDVSFVDMVHYTLVEHALKEEQALKDGKATKSPLRPSSAGECERALAYKGMEFTGQAYYPKPDPEAHVQLIFAMGHAVEAMLMKVFDQVEFFNVKYAQQLLSFFPIESGHKKIDQLLEGSNDGCFTATDGSGWKGVFDIKSKAVGVGTYRRTKWQEFDDQLRKMATVQVISETGYWIDDPEAFIKEVNDPHLAMNIWQLNLYCNSEFMKQRGFSFGSLIYFGKDTSAMRELRFRPSEKLAKLVELRFKSAANAIAKGDPSLAKQEFLLGSKKCAFCPYVKECWGVNENAAMSEMFKKEKLGKSKWPTQLEGELAEVLNRYHELGETDREYKRLGDEVMAYMVQNNLDKVQTSKDTVYELKRYKTTMSLKRSKA